MSERGEKGSATIVESAGAGPTDLVSEVENLVRKMIEHELAIAKLPNAATLGAALITV